MHRGPRAPARVHGAQEEPAKAFLSCLTPESLNPILRERLRRRPRRNANVRLAWLPFKFAIQALNNNKW